MLIPAARRPVTPVPFFCALAVAGGLLLVFSRSRHPAPPRPAPPAHIVSPAEYARARQRQHEALLAYLANCRQHHRTPNPLNLENLQRSDRLPFYSDPMAGIKPAAWPPTAAAPKTQTP